MVRGPAFPQALRSWRLDRQLSQRDLARLTDLSQKHLSLLERGRARPSEEVVLKVGLALQLAPHDRNLLLQSAGFAHAYRRPAAQDPRLAPAIGALRPLLSGMLHPAFAVDGAWNVLAINPAMGVLLCSLGLDRLRRSASVPPTVATNMMRLLLHPAGLRSVIANWEAVASRLVGHLQRQAALTERDDLTKLLRELADYPGVPRGSGHAWPVEGLGPLTELTFRMGDAQRRYAALCSTFATQFDITTDELRAIQFVPITEALNLGQQTEQQQASLATPWRT